MIDIDRLRRELPDREIHYLASVDSTMLAAVGLPVGAIVLTEEQLRAILPPWSERKTVTEIMSIGHA